MTDSSTYSSRPTPARTHSKDISTLTAFYSSSTSRPIHPPPSTPSGGSGYGYGYYAASPALTGWSSRGLESERKKTEVVMESPRKASKSKLGEVVTPRDDAASFRVSDRPQTAAVVHQSIHLDAEESHPGDDTAVFPAFRRSPSKVNEQSMSPAKRIPRLDFGREDIVMVHSAGDGIEMSSGSPRKSSSRDYRSERTNAGDRTTEFGIGIKDDFGDESMLISQSRDNEHHNLSDQHRLLLADDGMDDLGAVDSSFAQMIAGPAKRRAGSIKACGNADNNTSNNEEFTESHHNHQNADESIMWDFNLDKRDSSPAKRLSAILPRSPSSRSLAQTLAGDNNIMVEPLHFGAVAGSPIKSKRRIDSGVGDGAKVGMSRWEEEQMMARRRVDEMMRAQEKPVGLEEDVFGVPGTPARSTGGIVRSASTRSVGGRAGQRDGAETSTSNSGLRERQPKTSSRHHDEAESPCKQSSPRKSRDVDGWHGEGRSSSKHLSPSKLISQYDQSDDRIRSPRHAPDADRWFSPDEAGVRAQPCNERYNLDRSTRLPASPSIRRNMATVAGQRDLREERIDVLDRSVIMTVPLVDSTLDRSTVLPASPSIRRNIGMLTAHTDLREERLDDVDLGALDDSMLLTSPPGTALVFDRQTKMPTSVRDPLKHHEVKKHFRNSPMKPERTTRDLFPSPSKSQRTRAPRPLPAPPGSEYGGNETIILGMMSPNGGDETFFNLMATGDKSLDMLKGMGDADESIMETASLNKLNLPRPKIPTDTPKRSKQSVSRILPIELTSSPIRQTSAKLPSITPAVGATPKERGTLGRTKQVLSMEAATPRITQTPGAGAESDSEDDEYAKVVFKPRASKPTMDAFKSGAFASPAPQSSTREKSRMLDDILAQATPHGMNSLRNTRAALVPPASMHKLGRTPSTFRGSVLTPSGPPRTNPPQSSRKQTWSGSTTTLPKPRCGEVQRSDGPAKVGAVSSGMTQRTTTTGARSLTSVAHLPRLPATRPSASLNAPLTRPGAASGRPLPTVPSIGRGVSSSSGVRSKKEGVSPDKMLARPPMSVTTLPRGIGRVPSASISAISRPTRSASSQPTTLRPSTSSTATSRIPGPSKISFPSRIPSGSRTSAVPHPGGSRVASASLASKSRHGLPKPAGSVDATRPQVPASRTSGRPAVTGAKASASSVMAFAEQVLAGKNRQMVANARAR